MINSNDKQKYEDFNKNEDFIKSHDSIDEIFNIK